MIRLDYAEPTRTEPMPLDPTPAHWALWGLVMVGTAIIIALCVTGG